MIERRRPRFRPDLVEHLNWLMAELLRQPGEPEDAEAAVTTRNYDDWTIDRWKADPTFPSLEIDEPRGSEQAPPLWKDLTLASIVALALWVAAAVIFR